MPFFKMGGCRTERLDSYMKSVYLDNSATTCVDGAVADLIYSVMTKEYGNPSSLHQKGLEAELVMNTAKNQLAQALSCSPDTLYFTSGGTEANNLAILGGAAAHRRQGNRVVISAYEHSSVIASGKELEKEGFAVEWLSPGPDGRITPQQLERAVDQNTLLASVMLVNNEIGAVNPVGQLARIAHRKNPNLLFHCDAVQAFGKLPVNVRTLDVDLLTVSGHKIHAPKGVGALYLKKGVRILPRTFGGEQQRRLRPGTEPVPLIAGLGLAAQMAVENLSQNAAHLRQLNQRLREGATHIPDIWVNSPEDALDCIVNLSVVGIRSEIMLHFLEGEGIYVSSGSACAKGAKSHVLTALGLPESRIDSALRISFSRYTTSDEIDALLAALQKGMGQLRRA